MAWPAMVVGHVQICKNLDLGTHELGDTQSPPHHHWPVISSMPISLPVNFTGAICLSPCTDYLLLTSKSLAQSSICKCLNIRWQVAVLCKTGSIWISKCPRWREERRKERRKSYVWRISSKLVSGMFSGSPSRPGPLCNVKGCIPSEKLWASPLLRKQNHFCKLSGNNESLNPSPAGLTHTSGNNCYIPKGQQMSAKHGKGGSARFIASQAQKGTTLFVCSCIVKTHQELLVNSIMILRYTASQI